MFFKIGSEVVQLPVLPPSFSVKESQNNEEININTIGTVKLLGKRGLKEIEIASFFPKQNYDFCKCTPRAPYEYCEKFKAALEDNTICVLTITGTNIAITGTIEEFEYGEEDRAGDVSYTINFKEYRAIKTARVSKKVTKKVYKVKKKGETFYYIARKFTGNSANAKAIAKANKKKVSAKLKKGQKIVINVTS